MVQAVADPQEYGYAKLYALLLTSCQKELAAALRVFTHPGNFPLLVNCVQGKDRTGLIAMLVLMLCGVPHVVRLQPCFWHGPARIQLSSGVCHMVRVWLVLLGWQRQRLEAGEQPLQAKVNNELCHSLHATVSG